MVYGKNHFLNCFFNICKLTAGKFIALRGGNPKVTGSGVKNHPEFLSRSSQVDLATVLSLKGKILNIRDQFYGDNNVLF